MAQQAKRNLKQIETSIDENRRVLNRLWLRVEDLNAQIQTNQKTVEASKAVRKRKYGRAST